MKITDECYQKIFILDEKMGCLFSKNDKPNIKIFDCKSQDDDFHYLR